jgi:hypothetical protein
MAAAEQFAGDWLAVTGCGLVERAAVGQPACAVVEEELRRAGGVVGAADLLVGVDEVGEMPAGAAGLPGKLVRPVVGVSIGVVGADAHDGQAGVVRQQRAERGLDVADVGAVVAQEGDQQCGRGVEVVTACHRAAGVGEGEVGRLGAERDHRR